MEAYQHATKETEYEVLSPRDKRAQARASYCKPLADAESNVLSTRDRRAVARSTKTMNITTNPTTAHEAVESATTIAAMESGES